LPAALLSVSDKTGVAGFARGLQRLGYELFATLGAIAAGAAALFVGNGIEQSARRRFEQAAAFAEEDLSAAVAAATTAEQSGDLFSERESATGYAERALAPAAERTGS